MLLKRLMKCKFHIYGLFFAVFSIFIQCFSGDIYFFLKKFRYDFMYKGINNDDSVSSSIINELNRKNISLQIENESYHEYKKIFNKLNNKKYKSTAIVDVLYIKDKYMIVKSSNDLNVNDVIIDNDDFLVGIVVSVNKDIAKVVLLTSGRVNIPVKVLGKNVSGVITGKNGTGFKNCDIEMYDIDNSKDINDGDIVLTSGKYGLTPVGLKIGRVYNRNKKFCIDEVKYNSILFSTNFDTQLG